MNSKFGEGHKEFSTRKGPVEIIGLDPRPCQVYMFVIVKVLWDYVLGSVKC